MGIPYMDIVYRIKEIIQSKCPNIQATELIVIGNPAIRPPKDTDNSIIYISPVSDSITDEGVHKVRHHFEVSIYIVDRGYNKPQQTEIVITKANELRCYIHQHPHLTLADTEEPPFLVTKARVNRINFAYDEFFITAEVRIVAEFCTEITFPTT